MMLESSEGARISNIQETGGKKRWPANSTDADKGKTSSLVAEKQRKGIETGKDADQRHHGGCSYNSATP